MIFRNVLLPGVVVPIVATAVALLILRGRWQPRRGVVGVAVAAGFLAGFVAVSGWPRWPPVEATQRLFFLVVGAAIAGWLVAQGDRRWLEVALEVTAIALLLPLMLGALIEHTWSPPQTVLWLGGLFLAALALNRALGASFDVDSGDLLSLGVRLTVLVGVAVVLGLSESFRLAQLVGALACGMATVSLLTWRRGAVWRRSDALVASTALTGLLLVGRFYAALSVHNAVLLFIAILLLRPSGKGSRWLRLAPLLPLFIALALAIATFLQPDDDPWEDYSHAPRETLTVASIWPRLSGGELGEDRGGCPS